MPGFVRRSVCVRVCVEERESCDISSAGSFNLEERETDGDRERKMVGK